MRYTVIINCSGKHVVPAKSALGAVKSVLSIFGDEIDGAQPEAGISLDIRATPILPKKAKANELT